MSMLKQALWILPIFGCATTASTVTLAEIMKPRLGEIHAEGFEITAPATVKIDAVGLKSKYSDDLIIYSWIIDSKTREAVWVLRESNSERVEGDRNLRKAEANLDLPAGRYELYLYPGSSHWVSEDHQDKNDFGNFIGGLFFGDDEDRLARHIDKCYLKVNSASASESSVRRFQPTGELPGALFRATKLRDDEHVQWGFTLDKPMALRIYALIESPEGYRTPVDGGWIMNAETRKKVWELDRWDTERAGGGKKNRRFDEEVRLEAGNYILHFVTDDSHSYEQFNTNPPVDPFNWGITLFPGTGFDRDAFREYQPSEKGKPVIDFTRARDDDYFEQMFHVGKESKVHIVALGEYVGGSDEFADYGWIQDARTGKTVWEMTESNTEHAGGAEKNRLFDGVVTLPPGDYTAYYSCDGSHAYRSWNAGKPFDAKAWGMAIYPTKGVSESDFKQISVTEVSAGSDVLVSLTKVKDNQRRRASFTLSKPTKVRVYCLGEGVGNEMADYGWIENDHTGDIVWEMTMRSSKSAGGASKNRVFDGELMLDAGSYEVYYVTDGSHSFNDWNASRPRDYRNWGITISQTK